VFKLLTDNGQLLALSQRSPQQLEGQPQYPFGFPQIVDSQGKSYQVALSLISADPSDEIFVNADQGMVSQSVTPKSLNLKYLVELVFKRLVFILSYSQAVLALAFVLIIYWLTRSAKHYGRN
jgi:hypothetical protein